MGGSCSKAASSARAWTSCSRSSATWLRARSASTRARLPSSRLSSPAATRLPTALAASSMRLRVPSSVWMRDCRLSTRTKRLSTSARTCRRVSAIACRVAASDCSAAARRSPCWPASSKVWASPTFHSRLTWVGFETCGTSLRRRSSETCGVCHSGARASRSSPSAAGTAAWAARSAGLAASARCHAPSRVNAAGSANATGDNKNQNSDATAARHAGRNPLRALRRKNENLMLIPFQGEHGTPPKAEASSQHKNQCVWKLGDESRRPEKAFGGRFGNEPGIVVGVAFDGLRGQAWRLAEQPEEMPHFVAPVGTYRLGFRRLAMTMARLQGWLHHLRRDGFLPGKKRIGHRLAVERPAARIDQQGDQQEIQESACGCGMHVFILSDCVLCVAVFLIAHHGVGE